MRTKGYILITITLTMHTALIIPKVQADSKSSREYQVKAAFLYNFIKFIDWPEEKLNEEEESITIGIIGKDPFGNAFEPIKNKKVKNRKVVIKRFDRYKGPKDSNEQIKSIRQCHLLYICPSEKEKTREIINLIKEHSVLTVGEIKPFLQYEGVINFLMDDNKVQFEINKTAAEEAKLQIRSKLLRLAKRVIPK
jgi:hypothetical protein